MNPKSKASATLFQILYPLRRSLLAVKESSPVAKMQFFTVVKRNGAIVPFRRERF